MHELALFVHEFKNEGRQGVYDLHLEYIGSIFDVLFVQSCFTNRGKKVEADCRNAYAGTIDYRINHIPV